MSGLQCRLNWIGNVGLIQSAVNLPALTPDFAQVTFQAAAHDFVDLREIERSPQASCDSFYPCRPAAAGLTSDVFDGGLQRFRREAQGMREAGMQHQKLGDALRLYIGGIGFAIRLKGGARSQQAD